MQLFFVFDANDFDYNNDFFTIMALMTIMMMTVMASTDTWGLLRCSFPHQLARLARCFNVKVFMLFKSLSKDASNY